MADESKKVVSFSAEETAEVSAKLQKVLEDHEVVFHIHRSVDSEGRIQAELQIVKKAALVPKEEGVVSPIQEKDLKENGGNNNEETGKEADSKTA